MLLLSKQLRIATPFAVVLLICVSLTSYIKNKSKIKVKLSFKKTGMLENSEKLGGFEILCLKNWGKIIWGY